MCIITPFSINDFLELVERLPSKAYIVVTDEMSYVWLVPTVTTRHRHYVKLEIREDDWKKLKPILESKGFKIVRGNVSLLRE